MGRYYFTFGSAEQYPFSRGWVRVNAEDIHEAIRIFRFMHPDVTPGILNCAFYYTAEEFESTDSFNGAYLDEYCHAEYNISFLSADDYIARQKKRRYGTPGV